MNKKGFTLIELLATIVIISIVGGIATYGVISFINTSKIKSEKVFIEKLDRLIDDYLDLYAKDLSNTEDKYIFNKCKTNNCQEYNEENSYKATATKITSITIKNLVDKKIVTYEDLINPKNKQKCFNESTNPEILIYKDSDYVYYYYLNLNGNNTLCDITDENSIINKLPIELQNEVGNLS